MIKIHCDHDNAELELVKDNRTPEGLLRCPKCKCMFRVMLVSNDAKCYNKRFPQKVIEVTKVTKKRKMPPQKGAIKTLENPVLLTTPFYTSEDGKKQ